MKLRKLIEADRATYNAIEPVPVDAMWMGIDQRLRARKKRRRIMWTVAAASVLLGIGVPAILQQRATSPENNTYVEEQFLHYEQQYTRMAADKQTVLETDVLDPQTISEIMSELDQLDVMYQELKNEISNVPNAEELIETAIRFHERRLRILELLEKEIENHKRNQRYDEEAKI